MTVKELCVSVCLRKRAGLLEALRMLFNSQWCTEVIASRLEGRLESESSEHLVKAVTLNSSCQSIGNIDLTGLFGSC